MFLLTRQFFLYFCQYPTNANSKAKKPRHFLKELNKIFHVHLNILLTVIIFLLSSAEDTKNEPFLISQWP